MAKATVGTLNVELVARLEKLEAALKKAESAVKKSAKKMEDVSNKVSIFGGITATAAKVVASMGAIEIASKSLSAVTVGLKAGIDSFKESAGGIKDVFMAARDGITAFVDKAQEINTIGPALTAFLNTIGDTQALFTGASTTASRAALTARANQIGGVAKGRFGSSRAISSLRQQVAVAEAPDGRSRAVLQLNASIENLTRSLGVAGSQAHVKSLINRLRDARLSAIDKQFSSGGGTPAATPDLSFGSGFGIVGRRIVQDRKQDRQISLLEEIAENTRMGGGGLVVR